MYKILDVYMEYNDDSEKLENGRNFNMNHKHYALNLTILKFVINHIFLDASVNPDNDLKDDAQSFGKF